MGVCALAFSVGVSVGVPLHALELTDAQFEAQFSHSHATAERQSVQSELELLFESSWALVEHWRATASARVRLAEDRPLGQRRQSSRRDFVSYQPMSRPVRLGPNGRLDFRDLYVERDLGIGLFRLGKQQIVWGALDGLKVTDVLQPQNFREFILEDFGDSRISTWSAYADISLAQWRLELAWTPEATGHELPQPQAWFALRAPRFGLGLNASTATRAQPIPAYEHSARSKARRGGLRLTRQFAATSISLVAVSQLDFQPLATLHNGAVHRQYRDGRLFGLSADTALGPTILRFELAWRPKRYFNTNSSGLLTDVGIDGFEQRTAAIGMDVNGPFDLFINIQYLHDEVRGGRGVQRELVRPHRDQIATLLLRKRFLYDTLTCDVRWYTELGRGNGLVRASLRYALGDNTEIGLGADTFYGDTTGLFGQFESRDRLQIQLSHTF